MAHYAIVHRSTIPVAKLHLNLRSGPGGRNRKLAKHYAPVASVEFFQFKLQKTIRAGSLARATTGVRAPSSGALQIPGLGILS